MQRFSPRSSPRTSTRSAPNATHSSGVPRAGLLFYRRGNIIYDPMTVGEYSDVPADHQAVYFADETTLRSDEAILLNIEASEYLNDGGELVGNSAKGYLQYADGTPQTVLDRAFMSFRFHTTPVSFIVPDEEEVAPGEGNVYSITLTIPNIPQPLAYTVDNGKASVNGNGNGATSGYVRAGDTVRIFSPAPAGYGEVKTITLTIDGTDTTFDIVTRDEIDTIPDPFALTNVADADRSTEYTHAAILIKGIEVPIPWSVSGMTARVDGAGDWGTSGTIGNEQEIEFKMTSSSQYSTAVQGTFNLNSVPTTWTITTAEEPPAPPIDYLHYTDEEDGSYDDLTLFKD